MLLMKPYFEAGAGEGIPGGGGAGGAAPTVDAAETAKLDSFLERDEATLTPEEKTEFATLKGKYNVDEIDPLTDKPITVERKAELKAVSDKVKLISAKLEKDRTVEEVNFLKENEPKEEVDIYAQVDEITGVKLEGFDYGDTKPGTPEGIAKRESFIRETSQDEYDTLLKESQPRGYAFIKHLMNGGKEEDFFKPENQDFASINLTKTDIAGQESFYRKALNIRGLKEEHVNALVKMAKDGGKLFEESKAELESLQGKQQLDEQRQAEEQEQIKLKEQRSSQEFFRVLSQQIEKGLNGNPIPMIERRKFLQFVAGSVVQRDGKFLAVREIDPRQIEKELQADYFRFKGGDLKKLVEDKANNQNASKARNGIKRTYTIKGAGAGGGSSRPIALADL